MEEIRRRIELGDASAIHHHGVSGGEIFDDNGIRFNGRILIGIGNCIICPS